MVSGTDNIRQFIIQSGKGLRSSFPLFFAGLVAVHSVRDTDFVLLYQIAGTEHSFDIESLLIVCRPRGHQFEQRLVDIEFRVTLRIREQNHGK